MKSSHRTSHNTESMFHTLQWPLLSILSFFSSLIAVHDLLSCQIIKCTSTFSLAKLYHHSIANLYTYLHCNLPEIIVTFIYHTSPFITSSALLTHLTSISTTCWILNSTLAFLKSPLPWMSPLQLIQVCTEHYNFHNCHLTNLKFPSLTILPPWPLPAVTLPTVAISPC